jgi:hypothetical protein
MNETYMHVKGFYRCTVEVAVHILTRIKFMITALIPLNQTLNPLGNIVSYRLSA